MTAVDHLRLALELDEDMTREQYMKKNSGHRFFVEHARNLPAV